MKLAIIGVGNAGSKIADRILHYEQQTGRSLCREVIAINTARTDLAKPDHIPDRNRILVGQSEVKGHGVGGDPEVGAAVIEQDIQHIERVLDNVPVHDVDAFLVTAGLGGGTGSGGAPVITSHLQRMYDEPIYGLAILPGQDEGGRASLNTGRSIQSFANTADNLIAFDNDNWRGHGDTIADGYERTNLELAKRIVTLLAAGEVDGSSVSENVMDSSDIIRTLACGGLSSVAYAEAAIDGSTRKSQGLLASLRQNGENTDPISDSVVKVQSLVQRAVNSRLTLPCELSSTERSLIVLSGPKREFSRKGLERARAWLEEQTGSVEVLAGDDPRTGSGLLTATVLLSNVTQSDRIKALQKKAVNAQHIVREQEERREQAQRDLLTDENGELDPLI